MLVVSIYRWTIVHKSTATTSEIKQQALDLYLEGVGFRGIERLTNIHHTTVMKWVKNLAEEIEKLRPKFTGQVQTVQNLLDMPSLFT